MEVAYKLTFEEQRKKYGFCFTCEHCRYFNEKRDACAHGYPNELHRRAYYVCENPPAGILFCKEFELD